MKKQTAVEWLVENINKKSWWENVAGIPEEIIEQAKAMGRNQILEAYREGRTDQQSTIDKWFERTSVQYFNQTYNHNK